MAAVRRILKCDILR